MQTMRCGTGDRRVRGASWWWAAAAVVAGLAGAGAAQAVVLQVSPVRIDFEPDHRAQVLRVSNSGSQELQAQVRIMRWTQERGEDRLVPADDIVASPAILQVGPGGLQTVRLVRVQMPTQAPAQELSYRVLVDELPKKEPAAAGAGLKILMRYSIPLFIAPAPAGQAAKKAGGVATAQTDLSRVRAQVAAGGDGKTMLRVSNDGARALRISYLSTLAPGGEKRVLGDGLIGYVLAGQQMSWPVNLPHPLPADVILKARFNDDRQARALPLDGAGR